MEAIQQPIEQTSPTTPITGSNENPKAYSYGKRPLWQWILLYVVIGGIIYGGIYYFFLKDKGYNYSNQGLTSRYQQSTDQSNTNVDNMQSYKSFHQQVSGAEGWKTYENKEFGFSINYPIAFSPSVIGDTNVQFVKDNDRAVLLLTIIPNDHGYTAQQWFDADSNKVFKDTLPKKATVYPITINGVTGLRIDYVTAPAGYEDFKAILTTKKHIAIMNFGSTPNQTSLANTMLSTFKFIDSVQADLAGFPVFPNAQFIKKETTPACIKGHITGYTICNAISYSFETKEDFDHVRDWYLLPTKHLEKTGFVCTGGAGTYTSPREAYGGGYRCTKDGKEYDFEMRAEATKTTITFSVQTSPMPTN